MKEGQYVSSVGRMYRQETLVFEFHLMFGCEEIFTKDYDIEICVRSSQLSRRLWVVDYSRGFVPVNFRHHMESACGAIIMRRRKGFVLRLTPKFLKGLCPGVLTFGLRYIGKDFNIAETVTTEELCDIRY